MPIIKFSDGISINTDGKFKVIHISDGWYVVGKGMMIPVDDYEDGRETINNMKINEEY
jgi:hypothetical protein